MNTLAEVQTETSTIKLLQDGDQWHVEEDGQVWLTSSSRSSAVTNFEQWAAMHWIDVVVPEPFTVAEAMALYQIMAGMPSGVTDDDVA